MQGNVILVFYPTYENSTGECIACPENCSDCNEYNCTICMPGYNFVKSIEGFVKCGVCADNCESCTEERCTACYSIDGKCIQASCVDNCDYCNLTDKTCKSCLNGFGFNEDRIQCIKCNASNCMHCHDYRYFDTCVMGYGSPLLTICSIDTTQRVKCAVENCHYCRMNASQCLYCNDGYTQPDVNDHSDTSVCVQCITDGCAYCIYNSSFCKKCKTRYVSPRINGVLNQSICVKCPEGCFNCSKGYGLGWENGVSDGKCHHCSDQNCSYCRGNYKVYEYCIDSYCFDRVESSPTFGLCMSCNDPSTCQVDGCNVFTMISTFAKYAPMAMLLLMKSSAY